MQALSKQPVLEVIMPNENYKPLNCGAIDFAKLLQPVIKKISHKAGASCPHEKPFFANGKQRKFCFVCRPKETTVKNGKRKPYEYKNKNSSVCLSCGDCFEKTQYHNKYCSDICRNRFCNVARQKRIVDRTERSCRNCGAVFTPKYGDKNKLQCSIICLNQYATKRAHKRMMERMRKDPVLRLARNMRSFINQSIIRGGYRKRSRANNILGCNWEFFKTHIEKQFHKGMSWDNRSDWHLDHIRPIASAKTEDEVISLNHYTNLRPMWAIDNLIKGAQETYLI